MKQPRMGRILKAAFNGLEIVDAKKSLVLFPTQEDFDKGVRMDPQHCGFANCVQRACGSTQAHFFKRYVYIDHFDDDGKRRVRRYCVSKHIFDALSAFDRGKKVKVSRAFVLRAPAPSETMAAQRAYNKSWRKSDAFKAINREKAARAELRRAQGELEQAKSIASKTDAVAGSVKAREVERRVNSAKQRVVKARADFDRATKIAAEVRKETYGTGKATPRHRDLHVRSGQGAWLKEVARKAA